MNINQMIDHTKLGANVSLEQLTLLFEEAKTHHFKSVCVNPIFVSYAKKNLLDSDVLVCTVIGFPHGTHQPVVKSFETKVAIKDGADEIDMVMNISKLKQKDYAHVAKDIKGVVKAAQGRTVKVIIETCYLTKKEIVKACKIAQKAGAHFVKTSTGFGSGGATYEDVKLMKETVLDQLEVKASGGVRTYEDAIKMIEAGATRIGTSNGVQIVTKGNDQNDSNTSY
jgi:deoxyribose-phosphate aldolase